MDDVLAHLNKLEMTWGSDLEAFLQESRQQTPAAGDTGDGKAQTGGSSLWGAVEASWAPAGRAQSDHKFQHRRRTR